MSPNSIIERSKSGKKQHPT